MGTPNWRAMAAARPVNIKLAVIAEANAIMALAATRALPPTATIAAMITHRTTRARDAGYRTAVTIGPGGLATRVTSVRVTTASDRKITSAPMSAFARTSPII